MMRLNYEDPTVPSVNLTQKDYLAELTQSALTPKSSTALNQLIQRSGGGKGMFT